MPWASDASVAGTVWGIARPQRGSDDPYGQDFEYQFRDEGHGVFSDDRPLLFLSSLSEGAP